MDGDSAACLHCMAACAMALPPPEPPQAAAARRPTHLHRLHLPRKLRQAPLGGPCLPLRRRRCLCQVSSLPLGLGHSHLLDALALRHTPLQQAGRQSRAGRQAGAAATLSELKQRRCAAAGNPQWHQRALPRATHHAPAPRLPSATHCAQPPTLPTPPHLCGDGLPLDKRPLHLPHQRLLPPRQLPRRLPQARHLPPQRCKLLPAVGRVHSFLQGRGRQGQAGGRQMAGEGCTAGRRQT